MYLVKLVLLLLRDFFRIRRSYLDSVLGRIGADNFADFLPEVPIWTMYLVKLVLLMLQVSFRMLWGLFGRFYINLLSTDT
jgi:hypothetical protein